MAQIPQIRQMAEQVFPETYGALLTKGQVEYMMEWMYSAESLQKQLSTQRFWIARHGTTPCGYISVERFTPTLYHVHKIYVLSSFHGQGIGRQLLEHIFALVQNETSAGCGTVELTVNRKNPAVGFYERMGFHVTRQVDQPIGQGFYMNDYIMQHEVERMREV